MRLFVELNAFVLGDPTEIERPQARKTAYVGRLRDKQGGCTLVLATPFRGGAIPFHLVTHSSLDPEEALAIYFARMKIEECFRQLKSLLGAQRVMNQKQTLMEKTLALLALAYVVGMLTGEMLRDFLYESRLPVNRLWSWASLSPSSGIGRRGPYYGGSLFSWKWFTFEL